LSKNEANHREVGPVAAKYVETLQRSNEQLVKISALLQKRETQEGSFKIDNEQMFDLIQQDDKEKE